MYVSVAFCNKIKPAAVRVIHEVKEMLHFLIDGTMIQ